MKILFLNIGDDGVKGESCARLLRQHETLQPRVTAITLELRSNHTDESPSQFVIPRIKHINGYGAIIIGAHGVLGNTRDCFREMGGPTTTKKIMNVMQFTQLFTKIFRDNGLNLSDKNIILLNCYGARSKESVNHQENADEISFSRSFAGKFSRRLAKEFSNNLFYVTAFIGRVRIKSGAQIGEIAVQTEPQIALSRYLPRLREMRDYINGVIAHIELSLQSQAKREIDSERGNSYTIVGTAMIFARQKELMLANATHQQLIAQYDILTTLSSRIEEALLIETVGYGGVKFRCKEGRLTYRGPKMRSLALILDKNHPHGLAMTLDPIVIARYLELAKEVETVLAHPVDYDALTNSLAASSELSVSSVFRTRDSHDDEPDPDDDVPLQPSPK